MEINRIDAYNLLEFMLLVEAEIKQGYSISTENDLYPNAFGSFYTCGLVKGNNLVYKNEPAIKVEEPEVEQPKAKPARKTAK